MKNILLKKFKKCKKKVFTKEKGRDIITKDYNPFEVNCRIYKRRDGLNMENIELKRAIFIDEQTYQQTKEKMGKKEDYFTEKELEKLT